jgi:adenylate cyclase
MSMSVSPDPAPLLEGHELERQRRVIVVVDLAESVRLMQQYEDDVIDRWRRFVREVRREVLPALEGRLVKSLGDGMLIEFRQPRHGVAAALQMQRQIEAYNLGVEPAARMLLRVGVHTAEVLVDELDVFGSGVNLAARLAGLAAPGEIVVSAEAREGLVADVDADIEDLGLCYVKHLDGPLRAYRIGGAGAAMQSLLATGSEMRPLIAVLPLAAGAGTQAWPQIGEIIADRLISGLSRSPLLRVMSRLTTQALAARPEMADELAQRVQADYLLAGSVSAARGRANAVRVDWQLCDSSHSLVWAESAQVDVEDCIDPNSTLIFDAMQGIGDAILQEQIRRSALQNVPSLPAYALLLGAIGVMHRVSTPRQFDQTRELLEHLISRYPRHPTARAWLGKWHVLRVVQGWSPDPKQEAERALATVSAALEIEPNDALALTIDGQARGYLRSDLAGARQRHQQALAVNPNESLAWLHMANTHLWLGEGEAALDCALRAQQLSPLDPLRAYFDAVTGAAALAAGQYELAVKIGERAVRGNRMHTSALRCLAIAQALTGRLDVARATAAEAMALEPHLTLRRYLERYPGRDQPHAKLFAQALRQAGVPE